MSTDERFIELWNDYVEGDLDETGATELRRLLAQDDRLVQMAADSYRTHRLLGLMAQGSESQQDDFVQQTLNRLPAEDGHFVGAVMRQVSPGRTAAARPRTRSLTNWRWIMRSPVSRTAAVTILVLAITGVAFWFHGGGATPTFADFIEPILEAKTAKFKMTLERTGPAFSPEMVERMSADAIEGLSAEAKERMSVTVEKIKGLSAEKRERLFVEMGLSAEIKERLSAEMKEGRLSAEMKERLSAEIMKMMAADMKKGLAASMKDQPAQTSEVMVLDATRSRMEKEMPDKSKSVMIFDWGRGKSLTLEPASKRAMVITTANMSKDQVAQQDMFGWFRSILLDARDKPDVKREPLGEKDIDGRRVVGFRVSSRGSVVSLWGDPKTGLPVRAETTMAMYPNMKTTMSDFVFDVDMDESLFSVEPPAGYELIKAPTLDASPAEEKDLLETFRRYSELSGGAFLDSLDMEAMHYIIYKKGVFLHYNEGKPTAKQTQQMVEASMELQRGLMFTFLLPPEADAHYAGKGVSLGAADTPIFWYRPKDAKKYRVIYADLSVREADTPPSVPNAQPVPAPASPKK